MGNGVFKEEDKKPGKLDLSMRSLRPRQLSAKELVRIARNTALPLSERLNAVKKLIERKEIRALKGVTYTWDSSEVRRKAMRGLKKLGKTDYLIKRKRRLEGEVAKQDKEIGRRRLSLGMEKMDPAKRKLVPHDPAKGQVMDIRITREIIDDIDNVLRTQ